jgi:hypothetical protein
LQLQAEKSSMLPGTKVNLKRRAQKGRIVPLQLLGGKRRRKESPYAQFETMKRRHDGCSTGAESLDPFHRPIDGAKETPYLEQKVEIKDDILRDASGFAVMMPWEAPLMVRVRLHRLASRSPSLRSCNA